MLSTAAISKPRFPGWDSDGCVWIKHLPLFRSSGARWVWGCKRAQATPRGSRLAMSESERRGQVILKDQRILTHRAGFCALSGYTSAAPGAPTTTLHLLVVKPM